MPKRKSLTPAGHQEAENEFLLPVLETYKTINGRLSQSGAVARRYDLNDENIRVDMLQTFKKIHDDDSALDWCRRFGNPVKSDLLEIRIMIQAANSIAWQSDLLELVRDGDDTQLSEFLIDIRSESELNRFISYWSARDWSTEPWAKPLSKAGGFWDYFSTIQKKRIASAPLTLAESAFAKLWDEHKTECSSYLFYTFGRSKVIPKYHTISSDTIMEVTPPDLCFAKKEFEKSSKKSILLAAQAYLAAAANWMLVGVQPSVQWKFDSDRQDWILEPGFKIVTPWQAMAITFQQELCGAFNYGYCKNERCKKLISGRSDKQFCSDACRKHYKRNIAT